MSHTRHPGRRAVEFLIDRGRLEAIDGTAAVEAADLMLGRAQRRLLTAEGGISFGDVEGGFAAAYDAYRMAAEGLLVRQGLRAPGGDGSHMAVEDAISGQFGSHIVAFAKPTFERLRRSRHAAQYFDPSAPEIDEADARWALDVAKVAVDGAVNAIAFDPPRLFRE